MPDNNGDKNCSGLGLKGLGILLLSWKIKWKMNWGRLHEEVCILIRPENKLLGRFGCRLRFRALGLALGCKA